MRLARFAKLAAGGFLLLVSKPLPPRDLRIHRTLRMPTDQQPHQHNTTSRTSSRADAQKPQRESSRHPFEMLEGPPCTDHAQMRRCERRTPSSSTPRRRFGALPHDAQARKSRASSPSPPVGPFQRTRLPRQKHCSAQHARRTALHARNLLSDSSEKHVTLLAASKDSGNFFTLTRMPAEYLANASESRSRASAAAAFLFLNSFCTTAPMG